MNILLIEDNPGDAQLVKIYMKEAHIKANLTHFTTLTDGLEHSGKEPVDLVLLDLSLPDVHGFKTLTTFIAARPKLPVIVLTGLDNEVVGEQSVKSGAQDYLVKGQFDANLLSRVIKYSMQRFKAQSRTEEIARNLGISERRYQEAQEMTKLGNWELDLVSNAMNWSDEVYRVFDFEPNSMVPTLSHYLRYLHPKDRPLFEKAMEEATKSGKTHKLEYRIIAQGRNTKHLLNHIKLYYDEITERMVLAGAIQNITERKVSEQLLTERNMQSRFWTKSAAYMEDSIAALRQMQLSMVSFSDLILDPQGMYTISSGQAEMRTALEKVHQNLEQLYYIYLIHNECLANNERQFRIEDVAHNLERLCRLQAEPKKIEFTHSIEANIPSIFIGDGKKLLAILHGLLQQGMLNIDKKGQIQFIVRLLDRDRDRIIIAFIIKDNGRSMPETRYEAIQQALEQKMDNSPESQEEIRFTALKRLTETIEGKLLVKHKEGRGNHFELQAPLKSISAANTVENQNETPPLRPLRILLVEDHFIHQIAIKKALTTWSDNIELDTVANGLLAAERIAAQHYDLILMDLHMPEMDGFTTSIEIRKTSNTPIIALSSAPTSEEAERCFNIGINDYLPKPFKSAELFVKVKTWTT